MRICHRRIGMHPSVHPLLLKVAVKGLWTPILHHHHHHHHHHRRRHHRPVAICTGQLGKDSSLCLWLLIRPEASPCSCPSPCSNSSSRRSSSPGQAELMYFTLLAPKKTTTHPVRSVATGCQGRRPSNAKRNSSPSSPA